MNQILNNILDLIILKEIQAEKEKYQNIPIKKPSSGKIKLDNNIPKDTIEPKIKKWKNVDSMKNLKINIKHIIKENNNINMPNNKAKNMIEKLNSELLIWIDEQYNNKENSSYLKLLNTNKNLTVLCFNNVDDAFKQII